jgi:hypothetical protein
VSIIFSTPQNLTVSIFSTATNTTNFDLAYTGDLEFGNNKIER